LIINGRVQNTETTLKKEINSNVKNTPSCVEYFVNIGIEYVSIQVNTTV
jgi:hypothetical protein